MGFSRIKSHLSRFRVGIAGAGGLGSNCSVALARSGVGTLVVCDFDVIDISNLNRQYYFRRQLGMHKVDALKENISAIDPEIRLVTHKERLTADNAHLIFSECDVIVEALDSAEMKEMLISAVQSKLKNVPVVAGSGLAGWGKNNELHCRKIDDTLYVCGDETSEDSNETPMLAPRVGIAANMQANMVLELLMNKK
ncbi:MAG: sulfur carrier protein ThiS adenylyltransferase ThiF [Chloroflexota bacterium]